MKVTGLTNDRYIVTCNGRRVPLHFTGTQGEWVAGVRYRAWQPPSCLHPTIPVHTPLIFDVLDTWTGRSVGGCTYHVAHPGGRSYDTFPVNANEAESRRYARFFAIGHTPHSMPIPPREAVLSSPDLGLPPPAPPVGVGTPRVKARPLYRDTGHRFWWPVFPGGVLSKHVPIEPLRVFLKAKVPATPSA